MRRRVLHFLVTPRQNCCWHRYAGVGIFVDGAVDAAAMTPNPYNPGRKVFDMLAFKTAISVQNIQPQRPRKAGRSETLFRFVVTRGSESLSCAPNPQYNCYFLYFLIFESKKRAKFDRKRI